MHEASEYALRAGHYADANYAHAAREPVPQAPNRPMVLCIIKVNFLFQAPQTSYLIEIYRKSLTGLRIVISYRAMGISSYVRQLLSHSRPRRPQNLDIQDMDKYNPICLSNDTLVKDA